MGEIVVNMGRFGAAMLPQLEALLPGERIVAWPADEPLEDPEVLATLAIAREDVEAAILPSIRWVHVLGAGVDGIPLEAIGGRVLTCSKGASSVPIAEYVLAVLLAHEKQLPEQWLSGPPAAWNAPQGGPLGGLDGTTMALVGIGAIGTEVARRALAFGVRVLAVRRSGSPMPLEGVEAAPSLEAALREADHVVVTAPHTPATHHLIGEASLAWVKPGAHLVNVARGALVDTEALLAALDDGRLAKASLDVAEGEPLAEGSALYSHPKVRLTPHLSWSSSRTGPRTIEMFVENLGRWRAGAPLAGVVDPAVGY